MYFLNPSNSSLSEPRFFDVFLVVDAILLLLSIVVLNCCLLLFVVVCLCCLFFTNEIIMKNRSCRRVYVSVNSYPTVPLHRTVFCGRTNITGEGRTAKTGFDNRTKNKILEEN